MNERVRTSNYDLAYIDYCKGMKYKDIAEKYSVTINTVKSWKTRYKWSKDNEKGVHTKAKKVRTQKNTNEKAVVEEVESVIENSDLTDKQRLFCVYYVKSFNAAKAYQKAYGCSRSTALTNGSALLKKTHVKNEIMRLKQNRLNREFLSEEDIFQKYMDIAFSDITDYVEFGQEEVPVMGMHGQIMMKDEKTGEKVPMMKKINAVRFLESEEVDGTLITEIKQGKDGTSIKLADRMKALDWLAAHMDMATAEQQAKINQINAQTELLKAKAQLDDEEEAADDGFLEALKGTAADDWSEEDVQDETD